MRKQVLTFLVVLLAGIFMLGLIGCGESTKTIKEGDLTVKYSTEAKKSVELPADYPKDRFPVYKNAFIMSVQNMQNSYVVACFCKESIKEVGAFYKDFFKKSQVISSTEMDDEYTILGVKDGYTYTVCVIKNTDQDDAIKGYPTSLAISLVPAPDGMSKSLEGMSGNLPAPPK
ncbi:MAG: hypothetical protein CVU90_12140 [Firmicutes bacterium HGW-Firmicutes-15]|nr:MAG: hypothetical protein CVU90_12140 [Firmicutes bacterium HGW-Firmicutes-15]